MAGSEPHLAAGVCPVIYRPTAIDHMLHIERFYTTDPLLLHITQSQASDATSHDTRMARQTVVIWLDDCLRRYQRRGTLTTMRTAAQVPRVVSLMDAYLQVRPTPQWRWPLVAAACMYVVVKLREGMWLDQRDLVHAVRMFYVQHVPNEPQWGDAIFWFPTGCIAEMELELLHTIGYDLFRVTACDYLAHVLLGLEKLRAPVCRLASWNRADILARAEHTVANCSSVLQLAGWPASDMAAAALCWTLADTIIDTDVVCASLGPDPTVACACRQGDAPVLPCLTRARQLCLAPEPPSDDDADAVVASCIVLVTSILKRDRVTVCDNMVTINRYVDGGYPGDSDGDTAAEVAAAQTYTEEPVPRDASADDSGIGGGDSDTAAEVAASQTYTEPVPLDASAADSGVSCSSPDLTCIEVLPVDDV